MREAYLFLPKRADRGAQILLLQQHELLQILQVVGDAVASRAGAANRLDLVGGAGEELDDAVVQIACNLQAFMRNRTITKRREQRVALHRERQFRAKAVPEREMVR